MTLAGGFRIKPSEAEGALSERVLSYAAMAPSERHRTPVSRHQVLLALCSTAVVVCAVGGVMRLRGDESAAPGVLSQKLLFGSGVGGDDVANSILDDARKKYEASKQRLAVKHSAIVPHAAAAKPVATAAVAAKPATVAMASSAKPSKPETAMTLEEKIANHKITTRDLVKEVQAKQQQQAQAMAGQLQDQTDDLIVASIKAMKHKEAVSGSKDTTSYLLGNALTRTEKQSLAHGGAIPEQAPPAAAPAAVPVAAPAPQAVHATTDASAEKQPAAVAPIEPHENMQVGVHPQLMETPPGMSLKNKKAPNTEVMLSSYDQQILKLGPNGADSAAPAPAPPSSAPAPAVYQQPVPQYAQPQYLVPAYQQLQGGMSAVEYPYRQQLPQYQQVAQYAQQHAGPYAEPGYPAPQYAYNGYQSEAPINGVPMQQQYQTVQYEQPQYRPYQGQQLYAAPQQYAYQQPEYAQQPYEQPYAYPQPQYAQYLQYAQRPLQQEAQRQMAAAPAAPAAPPPTPAQLLTKARQLVAEEHGQPALAATAPQTQGLAAYSTANPTGGAADPTGGAAGPGGGGLLWRMFTAPEGRPSTTVPMNKQYSAVINGATEGGYQQLQQMADAPQAMSAIQSPSQSLGADSMASIDPQNLGVGSQKDAIASLSMSSSAKQSVKAKMMALRQGILNDFTKTTDMGTQAGYLPPPPMP